MKQPKTTITREKNKDIGLVILLGLLLAYFYSGNELFIQLSVLCILVSLVIPIVLKPVSIAWYGLSEVLGRIVSRLLLSLVFFCIVTPIGVARRVICKERLLTEQWKKNRDSVFKHRSAAYTVSDIKNPF